MRLLIVSQYFWPENFRVNDFAISMKARGHDVTVLTGLPNYPEGRIFERFQDNPDNFASFEGIPIIRVPVIPRGSRSWQLVLNYMSFAISGAVLGVWKLRRRPFDAIFVFQTSPVTAALPAILLRKLKRAPLLMWVLDLWPDTLAAIGVVRSARLLAVIGALVRFIYKRCDGILVQSRAFCRNVRRYSDQPEKIRYFPGWAEGVFVGQAVDPAPEMLAYRDDFIVLFAGNVGDAQDFPAILAAAHELRRDRVRWLIVGDGRAAPALREEVAQRGLEERVILLGRFPIERMPSFFAGADALLVSLRDEPVWAMTIPGKVQSYLAAGRPILGMLNGEGARVIGDAGAGLAAPAGDSAILAANVRTLMTRSEDDRKAMGRAGREYCRAEFDRDRLLASFEVWTSELQFRYGTARKDRA
jgi:glycosyltransferase involved in cell wall biosynthesis